MIYFAIFTSVYSADIFLSENYSEFYASKRSDLVIRSINIRYSLKNLCVIYIMIAVQKKGNKWYLHEIAFVGIAKSENIWYYVTKILMQIFYARYNTVHSANQGQFRLTLKRRKTNER